MLFFDPRPLLRGVSAAERARRISREAREQQLIADEIMRRMQRAYEDASGMVIDVEMREVSVPALPDGSRS